MPRMTGRSGYTAVKSNSVLGVIRSAKVANNARCSIIPGLDPLPEAPGFAQLSRTNRAFSCDIADAVSLLPGQATNRKVPNGMAFEPNGRSRDLAP